MKVNGPLKNLLRAIGGKKIFKCPNSDCGMVMDRDANAAKNIFPNFGANPLQS